MEKHKIVDASDLILGRLATTVAKRLLAGEKIMVINAEKAVISGNKRSILERYKQRFGIRTLTAPWRGPFHNRRPDRFVKRTIRGMLPHKTPRGKQAYKRLIVHIGVPDKIEDRLKETLPQASIERIKGRYIRVYDLTKELGWNPSMEE
ncbi:MAG: 50S ribosomal protein L13 [Candidatus Hodarchaeota archaeon]